tara:strand:- start:657 stop:1487 length:831 start_codon:yes stop_codon:yes gene_type:complete
MPTDFLEKYAGKYNSHLMLAHLVESDGRYADWFEAYDGAKILDNSAFEMYKQKKPMYPTEKLLKMGERVKADYIVMSDYPDQVGEVTISAAKEIAPMFKEAGFGTFFCPQSKIGDLEDLVDSFSWAANSPLVDYIGFSILNIPNAYGVEKNNKLQRYLSRLKFVQELDKRGILEQIVNNKKKIHFLGMVDGPNEIELMGYNGYDECIDTWDSSAAVWYGLNGIKFDSSPTGAVNGKFEKEVDFNEKQGDNTSVRYNLAYIDKLCGGENAKEYRSDD